MNTEKTNKKLRASAEWEPFIGLIAYGLAADAMVEAKKYCPSVVVTALWRALDVAWDVLHDSPYLLATLTRYNKFVADFKPDDFDTGIDV